MAKKCKIKNCNNMVKCKELCHKHYNNISYKKHIEKRRFYDKSPKRRFNKFLNYCKRQNIPTDLTYEIWFDLIKQNKCYYCPNTLPTNGHGLDRKYPNIGYFKNNIVSCCERCNFTKRDEFSHIEFKIMMNALYKFREKIESAYGREKI